MIEDNLTEAVDDECVLVSVEGANGVLLGDIFEALSDHRRRYALYVLSDAEKPLPVSRVAERIGPWLHETPLDDLSEDTIRRIGVGLRHNHLPRLADLGVVEYDESADRVALGRLGPFEEYLSFAAARER